MARNPIIREPYPEVPTDYETPHGCIEGWVYLGFEGEDKNGEHVEEIERVHCRRCHGDSPGPLDHASAICEGSTTTLCATARACASRSTGQGMGQSV